MQTLVRSLLQPIGRCGLAPHLIGYIPRNMGQYPTLALERLHQAIHNHI
ncbi:hypothetical protein PT013_09610 [Xylella fastidiosa subsp. fastidiosa]|nr:hypothetical protein [Xylella fastidiosa]MDG5822698.1 hypothetical protein [Xylella fastidiosa subsp. pauca]WDF08919.1 hypothetical protein PT013_09610 [Xylella fastidiosa subsp. fastidiosa]WGZ36413.1 hypothetical protein O4443_10675 [Xylella fastidiosa subsp. pauca]WNY21204.1 hypothetical protein RO838_10745 [Xylella fastidiosa]